MRQREPASPRNVHAVVLAGGQGQRMGGIDKGLALYRGQPLVLHALDRLERQTWGNPIPIGISANRHIPEYARWGHPVWRDHYAGYEGPLAGLCTALQHTARLQAATQYVLIVPCDTPHFPLDLAQRLAHGLNTSTSPLAAARAGGRTHPLLALISQELESNLVHYLATGQRKVQAWMESCGVQWVDFDEPGDSPSAFHNLNSPDDLLA